MHRTIVALGAFGLLAACSQPAAEAPAPATPSLQADVTRVGACYARDYDATHLAAHPQQTVAHFHLKPAGPEWQPTETPGHFTLSFGFRLKASNELYSGIGMCTPNGNVLACTAEGDGGSFEVARNDDGLRVTLQRLEAEGARDFSPDLAEGDNRVMLLSPAAASACDER